MAVAILKSLGDPGVRIVEVEHPLGGLHADEVRARAEAVHGQLDEILTRGTATRG